VSTTTWNDEAWIDLGGGVEITPITDEATGERVGVMERHVCADERLSRCYVPFEGASPDLFPGPSRWGVVQDEPLTLSGSVLCRTCGKHGWIREGRWTEA
jgi:hypothetical protein